MWLLGGTRIFVQEHSEVGSQIIPRLQPLTGDTIYQWFGYESPRVSLAGLVVGTIDKGTIGNMYTTGESVTLSGPYSIYKDYYVKDSTFTILPATCQTLRPDLSDDTPVFSVKLELYEA